MSPSSPDASWRKKRTSLCSATCSMLTLQFFAPLISLLIFHGSPCWAQSVPVPTRSSREQ